MAATVVNITSLICVLLLLFNLSVPPYSQSSTRVDLELIGYSISTYFLSLVNLNLLGQVTFVYLFYVCVSKIQQLPGLIYPCCWMLASKHGTLRLLFAGEMHAMSPLFTVIIPFGFSRVHLWWGFLDLAQDVVVSPSFHFQPPVGLPFSRTLSFHLADLHQVLGFEIVDPTCGALDPLVFVLPVDAAAELCSSV